MSSGRRNRSKATVTYPKLAIVEITKKYDAKHFIELANNIKANIQKLNEQLHASQPLFDQYQLYLKGQIVFDTNHLNHLEPNQFLATSEFAALVRKYKQAARSYEELKSDVVESKMLPAAEIDQIEKSVKFAADPCSLSFFPLYQNRFDQKKAEIETEKNQLIDSKKLTISQIEDKYKGRKKSWVHFHIGTAFASIPGIGLPFLVGGFIGHALDKIVTSIRLMSQKSDIKKIEKNTVKQIDEANKNIHKEIESGHVTTKFRQTFFQLAQTCNSDENQNLSTRVVPKPR